MQTMHMYKYVYTLTHTHIYIYIYSKMYLRRIHHMNFKFFLFLMGVNFIQFK